MLADVLFSRSLALLNTGQFAEGTEEGRRALAMARDLGDPAAEAMALEVLGIAAWYRGDADGAIELLRRHQQIIAGVPAASRGGSANLIRALIEAGDLAAAESECPAALARWRDAGDVTNLATLLMIMAELDMRAGRFQDAATHLREGLQVACGPATSVTWRQRPVALRAAVRRDRALRRSGHGVGRPGRPRQAARARWRVARRDAQKGGNSAQDPAGAGTGPGPRG